MEDPKQHITALVQRSNLPPDKASTLLARFDEFVGIAQEWEAKAKSIVVLDAGQTAEMKVAREGRQQGICRSAWTLTTPSTTTSLWSG